MKIQPEKLIPYLVVIAVSVCFGAWITSDYGPSLIKNLSLLRISSPAKGFLTAEEEAQAKAYAHFVAGIWHENFGRSQTAIEEFEAAKLLDPDSARTRIHLGVNLMNAGFHREASLEFDRVADSLAQSTEVRRIAALIFVSQGRYTEAIKQYGFILDEQPDDAKTVEALADLHTLKNNLEQAEKYFLYLTELTPSSADAFYNLGVIRSRQGKYDHAERDLVRAIQLNSESIQLWYALALVRDARNDTPAVIEALSAIELLKPESAAQYVQVARLYISAGDLDAALRQYGKALDLDPINASLVKDALFFCVQNSFYRKAREWSAAAIERGVIDARIYFTHAYALEALGETDKALESYLHAVEEDPDFADAHFYLGVLYSKQGDRLSARKQLRRTITLNPNAAEAYNYLGYMNVEEGIYLNEAVQLIEKAVSIDPSNAAFADSLGWAYYKKGLYDQAIRQLEHAVALDGADQVIRQHLRDAYLKAGEEVKAEKLQNGLAVSHPKTELTVPSKQ